jgi:hypothetical protein
MTATFDNTPSIIGRGQGGIVHREPGNMTVRKNYVHPVLKVALNEARREYAHLKRFNEILEILPGISCPRPISVEVSTCPSLQMSYCKGVPLSNLIEREVFIDIEEIDYVASRLALALHLYVNEFQEPYFDFCAHNILWDKDSQTVFLVDMGIPYNWIDPNDSMPVSDMEISLGNFIGLLSYHLLSPRRFFRLRLQHHGLEIISSLMRHTFYNTSFRTDQTTWIRIDHASSLAFQRKIQSRLSMRYLWYLIIGRILYRRYFSRLVTRVTHRKYHKDQPLF